MSVSAVFVVGNSRSGTTMMGRILGRHPSVKMFRELHFFEELWSPDDGPGDWDEAAAVRLAATLTSIEREGYMAERNPQAWLAEGERIVAALPAGAHGPGDVYRAFLKAELRIAGKQVACEQTPRNLFYLQQIFELFPDAVVVEMVRDPRDVMVSKKYKWKRLFLGDTKRPVRAALLSWANYHPLITPRLWAAAVRAGGDSEGRRNVLRVRFEDFLREPEATVRSVCGRLGVEFHADMLDVEQTGSSSAADSSATGVRQDAAGRWQRGALNSTEIATCQRIAAAEMAALDYPLVRARRNPLRLLGYYALVPIKLAAALVLNLGRLASLSGAIKRRL